MNITSILTFLAIGAIAGLLAGTLIKGVVSDCSAIL